MTTKTLEQYFKTWGEPTKLYVITDGEEIFGSLDMTLEEYAERQEQCEDRSDGNLYWIAAEDLPEYVQARIQFQGY